MSDKKRMYKRGLETSSVTLLAIHGTAVFLPLSSLGFKGLRPLSEGSVQNQERSFNSRSLPLPSVALLSRC